ncbi:MAG: dethiobiotin synthase [Chitinivibrionales bacterium]|nr:dethiobiotin synthase [Chitinivibrionales bacterium]MBD3358296.1 dethiobiotin synthase [Chitinivibrionales bacterium]
MSISGFFVTGTDTGIGKTHVSRVLADTLADRYRVTYLKPVQTGCIKQPDGELVAPDYEHVMAGKATKCGTYADHVPYRYAPACSPHLAAQLAHEKIAFSRIDAAFCMLTRRADITIVEGAGGIQVPLGAGLFTLDLVAELGIGTVVVTTPRLGTLNHTFLTIEALRRRNIKLLGVAFNNHVQHPKDFIHHDNRSMIEAFASPAPLIEIDYGTYTQESIREFCDEIRQQL